MTFQDAFLKDIVRSYRNYKVLGERAIAQVPDADLHTLIDADANSIAIIVKHVAGNLRSRFTDFLTTDGEKADRDRDAEFEMPDRVSREVMLNWWNTGWDAVLKSLEGLTSDDLARTVYIRGEAFLVAEALNRSITHTAYHVGQIVTLARHFTGSDWKTLSIPRGQSLRAAGDFKTKGLVRG
ncbi:MAG: hypothetical protein C5B57_02900 [Blastocatellia bacterium]|nr:MAG: hypothetical protein C5B57_02900 [Blastocatellia bacterium]